MVSGTDLSCSSLVYTAPISACVAGWPMALGKSWVRVRGEVSVLTLPTLLHPLQLCPHIRNLNNIAEGQQRAL